MELEKTTLATRRGPSLRDKDIMSVKDPETGCNIWHKRIQRRRKNNATRGLPLLPLLIKINFRLTSKWMEYRYPYGQTFFKHKILLIT